MPLLAPVEEAEDIALPVGGRELNDDRGGDRTDAQRAGLDCRQRHGGGDDSEHGIADLDLPLGSGGNLTKAQTLGGQAGEARLIGQLHPLAKVKLQLTGDDFAEINIRLRQHQFEERRFGIGSHGAGRRGTGFSTFSRNGCEVSCWPPALRLIAGMM